MKFEKRLEHLEKLQVAKRYEPPLIVSSFIKPIDGEAEKSFREVMALLDKAAAIKSAKANHIRQ
jgi:hypothetical protein